MQSYKNNLEQNIIRSSDFISHILNAFLESWVCIFVLLEGTKC